MNDRPTPETDAETMRDEYDHVDSDFGPFDSSNTVPADFARRLERERDEAREETNRTRDFMDKGFARAREEIAAERALADRLAGVLFGCTAKDQVDAYDAWEEARQ